MWPTSLNVNCEFTPNNVTNFNVQMPVNVANGQWVVSDDWALTPLQSVPQLTRLLTLPIKYWARDYSNTVDRAATSWNNTTGRNLFVKATSEADAKLIIDGVYTFCDGAQPGDNDPVGRTYGYLGACSVGPGQQLIQLYLITASSRLQGLTRAARVDARRVSRR